MKKTQLIINGGECGKLVRDFDWSKTPLGPIDTWSPAMLANVNTMLNSPLPYVFMCGQEGVLIYNDDYAKFALDKHPEIMGANVAEAWPEIADYNLDIIKRVHGGETIYYKDQLLKLRRNAKLTKTEDVYIDLTYGPLYDAEGRTAAVAVSVIETTDKVRSNQSNTRLRKESKLADDLFNTVVDSMVDHVYYFNKQKKFMYANQAVADLLGVEDPKTLVGKKLSDIFPPTLYKQVNADIEKVFTTEKPVHNSLSLTDATGALLEFEYTFSPVRDSSGSVVYVSGNSRDVTEKNALERSRKEAEALSAERDLLIRVNSIKDDFISVASHELRTPATAVKQYLGLVLEGYAGELTAVQKDFIDKANISNDRQLKTINDLLKVARIESNRLMLEKQTKDMHKLLTVIEAAQKPLFAKSEQKIELKLPDYPVEAIVDIENITIAIDNIIDNARKYSRPSTTTTISLRKENGVVIAIADQGVGVDKADISKLFTKFQRIPNDLSVEVGGTGLGLYWSKKIVELHDGTVSARQNTPVGMVFEIVLSDGEE